MKTRWRAPRSENQGFEAFVSCTVDAFLIRVFPTPSVGEILIGPEPWITTGFDKVIRLTPCALWFRRSGFAEISPWGLAERSSLAVCLNFRLLSSLALRRIAVSPKIVLLRSYEAGGTLQGVERSIVPFLNDKHNISHTNNAVFASMYLSHSSLLLFEQSSVKVTFHLRDCHRFEDFMTPWKPRRLQSFQILRDCLSPTLALSASPPKNQG